MVGTVGLYELGSVLGTGDFDCRIRKCKHTITGAEFAVKIYSKDVLSESPWMWDQLAEAVQVLRSMPKNGHIVEMVECFETESHLYILMPYVHSLSLYHFCHQRDVHSLSMERKRQIFEQIIRGVAHMHRNRVAHLGIAPDHVLLGDPDVKLSFLVACKNVQVDPDGTVAKITSTCGTTHTVAPEVLRQHPYDPFAADVWSCGVVLYFLLNNGRYPFDGANTTKHILRDERRPCNQDLPADARDLIETMLRTDPSTRPTVVELLSHPWLVKSSRALRAEVSWSNAEHTQLRIHVHAPPGLSEREHAALVIQGVWRFLRGSRRHGDEDDDDGGRSGLDRSELVPARRRASLASVGGGRVATPSIAGADGSMRLAADGGASSVGRGGGALSADSQQYYQHRQGMSTTALQAAQQKWRDNNKWKPSTCASCGHPPPQRVRPGVDPYPL